MTDATPEIIREIASELGVSFEQARKAAASQFHFTAHIMASDTWQTVHHHFLGKWVVSPRRLRTMRELQLSGKIKTTKSGRSKVVNRPDNFDDIDAWEKKNRK